MLDRNYYVICDDNCKFESMTKEQIYDAIAEATGSTPTPVDEAFITQIKEQNANHNLKVWKGTEAQYNAIASKDADTLYIIGTNTVKSVNTLKEEITSQLGTAATKNITISTLEPTSAEGNDGDIWIVYEA